MLYFNLYGVLLYLPGITPDPTGVLLYRLSITLKTTWVLLYRLSITLVTNYLRAKRRLRTGGIFSKVVKSLTYYFFGHKDEMRPVSKLRA